MKCKQTSIGPWVGFLIALILSSGCAGTGNVSTETPVLITDSPAIVNANNATISTFSSTATPTPSLFGMTITAPSLMLTATLKANPVYQGLNELETGTNFHFVFASEQKRAEGDANLANIWVQYTAVTTNGKDEFGSAVNGDWIVVYRRSLYTAVYYHNVSGKWITVQQSHDQTFFELTIELGNINTALRKSTFQLIGTEQLNGQQCLHYKDTQGEAGDIWITTDSHHMIQLMRPPSPNPYSSSNALPQFQIVFSNFGLPFTHMANVPPSD